MKSWFAWMPILVIAAAPAATATPDSTLPWTEVYDRLHPVASKDGIEVRSDVELTSATIEAVISLTREAYLFDRRLVFGPRSKLDEPIVVGLASAALARGRGGFTTLGRAALVGPSFRFTAAAKSQGFGRYALAHELEHVLMNRLGADVGKVPVYLFEGVATSVGARFLATQRSDQEPLDRFADELSALTRSDVEADLRGLRKPGDYKGKTAAQIGRAEHVGGLFVEFLRARLLGEGTDAMLGRVWMRSGKGEAFDRAFAAETRHTLVESEAAFLTFIAQTEGRPTERFQRTIFAAGHASSPRPHARSGLGEPCGDDIAIRKQCDTGLICLMPPNGPITEHAQGTCQAVAAPRDPRPRDP